MLLLSRTFERMNVDRIRLLLESNGIPVFIGNESGVNNVSIAMHTLEYSIWVVIDEQFQDALALLENEDHEVKNPVDVENYYKELEINKTKHLKKIFNILMSVFLCFAFAIFILIKKSN